MLPPPEERRSIREQSNLTQREFADALNTDPSCISHYEHGRREPRGDMRRAYGALLDRLQREVEGQHRLVGERRHAAQGDLRTIAHRVPDLEKDDFVAR